MNLLPYISDFLSKRSKNFDASLPLTLTVKNGRIIFAGFFTPIFAILMVMRWQPGFRGSCGNNCLPENRTRAHELKRILGYWQDSLDYGIYQIVLAFNIQQHPRKK